jgi:hypothetical protein
VLEQFPCAVLAEVSPHVVRPPLLSPRHVVRNTLPRSPGRAHLVVGLPRVARGPRCPATGSARARTSQRRAPALARAMRGALGRGRGERLHRACRVPASARGSSGLRIRAGIHFSYLKPFCNKSSSATTPPPDCLRVEWECTRQLGTKTYLCFGNQFFDHFNLRLLLLPILLLNMYYLLYIYISNFIRFD